MYDLQDSFDDWDETARLFSCGAYPFLFVTGPPGLSKTHTLQKYLGEDALIIKGNVTPIILYQELYHVRDNGYVVIDDADQLFMGRGNMLGLNMMKAICDTKTPRLVSYQSSTLVKQGFPTSFETSAHIAVISNDKLSGNAHLRALEDRGMVVKMMMDAAEIHRYVGTWWPDQTTGPEAFDPEVYEYFGAHLSLITKPSVRHYKMAARMKSNGSDRWRKSIFATVGMPDDHVLVKTLIDDASYPTMEARAKEYMRQTGRGRATFFNHKKELENLARGLTIKNTRQMRREAAIERQSSESPQSLQIFEAEPEPVEAMQPQEKLDAPDVKVVAEFRENFEAKAEKESGAVDEPPHEVGGPMAG